MSKTIFIDRNYDEQKPTKPDYIVKSFSEDVKKYYEKINKLKIEIYADGAELQSFKAKKTCLYKRLYHQPFPDEESRNKKL